MKEKDIKTTKCKKCGAVYKKNAKFCSNCGTKNRKHIILKSIGIVLAVIIIILGVIFMLSPYSALDDSDKEFMNSIGDSVCLITDYKGYEPEEVIFKGARTVKANQEIILLFEFDGEEVLFTANISDEYNPEESHLRDKYIVTIGDSNTQKRWKEEFYDNSKTEKLDLDTKKLTKCFNYNFNSPVSPWMFWYI